MLHGPFGEDGTIQGFFEIVSIPYIGCNHKSSAIAMDKAITKHICIANGIKTSPFVTFTDESYKKNEAEILKEIHQSLNYPLYVKPAHLGSAIGVTKVNHPSLLRDVILKILKLDYKIVVEEEIVGREIEFAILGNEFVTVFPPGEVLSHGEMYSYEAKYSSNAFQTAQKVDLEPTKIEEGKLIAKKVYGHLDCQGLSRVDFFLDEKGTFWLNEVNPIPGFTSISLYPSICQSNGIVYSKLLDKLIYLALHKYRKKKKINFILNRNANI